MCIRDSHCINPVNGKEVRMFIGDFLLASYGTGAVMAVPTHDQRDFEYAQAQDIEMIQVIDGADVSELSLIHISFTLTLWLYIIKSLGLV